MDARTLRVTAVVRVCSLLVIACALGAGAACGGTDGADAAPPPAESPDAEASDPVPAPLPPAPSSPAVAPPIRIWFKLDARLTDGLYMGERWVSPPTFQPATQVGDRLTVDARAEGAGASPAGSVAWTASDPAALSVSPPWGREVRIAVTAPGRHQLTVSDEAAVVTLTVDAAHDEGGAWRVTFSR